MDDRVDSHLDLKLLRSASEHSSRQSYLFAKRLIDVVGSAVALVLVFPIWLMIVAAIRMDSPGRAIFRQTRVGLGGQPFQIWKFRTMHADSDQSFHWEHVQRLTSNAHMHPLRLRIDNDPRITTMGRFLRKWSLDELPNLWNVLVGDMSLVGPRPLVPYELGRLHDRAARRLGVKPGITGMAQVAGRLDCSASERTDHDLTYVEERSLLADIQILLKTPATLVRRRGI